jgi:hypothetical protein
MTHDLDYPYITNRRENDLGVVNPPPTSFVDPKTTTPPATVTRGRIKCSDTDMNIYATVPQPIRVGDYIIVKRILSHWHFTRPDRYRFRYETGTEQDVVPIKDNIIDADNDAKDIEYLVVWV